MAKGGYLLLSLADIPAPIIVSGVITRAMGLVLKELSPVRTERKGLPESTPVMSLIVVPEFPQSMIFNGSDKPCRPLPCITSS